MRVRNRSGRPIRRAGVHTVKHAKHEVSDDIPYLSVHLFLLRNDDNQDALGLAYT
jgi:hypothetical protein